MRSSKVEWKVMQADEEELEAVLNKLSDDDHDVFSVQYVSPQWTIIVKKVIPEEQNRGIGFRPA